jgi:hypothetical protein
MCASERVCVCSCVLVCVVVCVSLRACLCACVRPSDQRSSITAGVVRCAPPTRYSRGTHGVGTLRVLNRQGHAACAVQPPGDGARADRPRAIQRDEHRHRKPQRADGQDPRTHARPLRLTRSPEPPADAAATRAQTPPTRWHRVGAARRIRVAGARRRCASRRRSSSERSRRPHRRAACACSRRSWSRRRRPPCAAPARARGMLRMWWPTAADSRHNGTDNRNNGTDRYNGTDYRFSGALIANNGTDNREHRCRSSILRDRSPPNSARLT